MEIAEECTKIRAKIERLQTIRFAPSQIATICGSIRAQRTNFNVFPPREAARALRECIIRSSPPEWRGARNDQKMEEKRDDYR